MPRIKTEIIEKTVVNGDVSTERHYQDIIYGEEPGFIKLYLQDILYLQGLSSQYYKVLMSLLRETRYASDEDGLCIALMSFTKKRILKELGWKKMQSLDNALHKLKEYQIIFPIDRGLFRLNPYLFGKGRWQDISKIRTIIGYDPIEGKTIKTEIETNAK